MRTIDRYRLAARFNNLPDGSRVVATGNFGAPYALMEILDGEVEVYKLFMLNAQQGIPDREGVTYESCFVGPGMRRSPRLNYFPGRLSLVPRYFSHKLAPDVVLLNTSMPRHGTVSLGIEVNVMPAAIEACRLRGGLVVAQLNPSMPYTYGDAVIPVDDIDLGIEIDELLATHASGEIDAESRQIGETIASKVLDGSTLQSGIGDIPNAVLQGLTERRGLRVWTEMFSDGVLDLEKQGCLDTDHPVIGSFLFGTRELYDWVNANPRVRMLRTERANDPGLIAANPMMTSVNTALQVDLFGQANASRLNNVIYSGTGGQTDFIVGALHSRDGHAYMAMRSWHPKAQASSIVGVLREATTSMQMSAVVTEQGFAQLFGLTQEEQAANLIEQAAHPRARRGLWQEADRLGLM